MITCKEDLINTYIENDHGELRDLYVNKAIELGFSHQGRSQKGLGWYNLNFIGICDGWESSRLGQSNSEGEKLRDYECKKLTLSDLKPEEKPRTKVEFVKVEDSIWHLESDFKAGDLFAFNYKDNYVQIETEGDFTLSHSADNLYRRIETQITEREAFIEEARKCGTLQEMFDSGKFKLVN